VKARRLPHSETFHSTDAAVTSAAEKAKIAAASDTVFHCRLVISVSHLQGGFGQRLFVAEVHCSGDAKPDVGGPRDRENAFQGIDSPWDKISASRTKRSGGRTNLADFRRGKSARRRISAR